MSLTVVYNKMVIRVVLKIPSKLSEDSIILNTCLASIIELDLLCSRDAPDDRVPMNEVVIKLNKIKSNYYSLCGSNGAHLVKYPEIPSLVHLETNQNCSEEKNSMEL